MGPSTAAWPDVSCVGGQLGGIPGGGMLRSFSLVAAVLLGVRAFLRPFDRDDYFVPLRSPMGAHLWRLSHPRLFMAAIVPRLVIHGDYRVPVYT